MKKEFFTYLNTTLTGKLPLAEVSVHLTAASGFLLCGGFVIGGLTMDEKSLTGYELSKDFFNFMYENPNIANPTSTALYFFIIEHSNRMGWKQVFRLPTSMAMDAIGIKNYKTYIKALNILIDTGFIRMVEKSKNQYSANIIALVKNTKALTKALTKASTKHMAKQVQSTVSIDKLLNLLNSKPINEVIEKLELLFNSETEQLEEIKEYSKDVFLLAEFCEKYLEKKYINSSFDTLDKLMRIDGYSVEQIKRAITFAVNDNFWQQNFLSPNKLRSKNKDGVKYIDVFLKRAENNKPTEPKITPMYR